MGAFLTDKEKTVPVGPLSFQVQPGRRLTGDAAMSVTRAKKPPYYQQTVGAQKELAKCKGFIDYCD